MCIVFIMWLFPLMFGLSETLEVASTDMAYISTDINGTDIKTTSLSGNVLVLSRQRNDFNTKIEDVINLEEAKEATVVELKQAVAVTPAGEEETQMEEETQKGEETITTSNITNSCKTNSTGNMLVLRQTNDFNTTIEDGTNAEEAREMTVTELKQAVAVTPAGEAETEMEEKTQTEEETRTEGETQTEEPVSNLICEQCACINHTVDCYNRNLKSSYEITDWEGLESFKPITIDLSSNSLGKFNRISSLPTVQYLNLSNCGLVDIEYASFSYLQELVSLDLSKNKLVTSSINRRVFVGIINPKLDRIIPFTKVQYLSLAYNEIQSLTQDVFVFMNALAFLDLSGNPLGDIDQVTMGAISDLVNLKELNLSSCKLETLPEGLLRRLRKLQRLDLSENRFTTVPTVLGEATNLVYLDLGGNLIETLNKTTAISNLTKLEELRLCGLSRLTRIADGALGRLRSLVSLHLCSNPRLTDLEDGFLVWRDEEIEQELWPTLKELYLNDNNLSAIYSAYLISWDRLTSMDFSNNPFVCTCKNQWIIDVLVPIITKLKLIETASNMVCTNPEDLKGMSFAQMHRDSKVLSCGELGSLKEASGPNMEILLGVMIGVFITFPLVLVMVLLWRNGYFARWRLTTDSSSDDEESDAF